MSTPQLQLQALEQALARLRAGQGSVADVANTAQGADQLLGALPERFGVVLGDLLNRLESSALFTEESCSFSQGELLESLQLWATKARERLG